MQKPSFGALLKGLPFWFYLIVALCLAGLLFWLYKSAGTVSTDIGALTGKSAVATQSTFTADEKTVQTLIQNYELKAHSYNTYKDASIRFGIYSGTYLTEVNQYFDSLDGTNNWDIVSQSEVTRVKIISKTDEKIIALACVNDTELELSSAGRLLKQLPTVTFAGAYVFVSSSHAWKLANYINVTDTAAASDTYIKSSADLQDLTGSLDPLLTLKCK
jgi:hypothetical protein